MNPPTFNLTEQYELDGHSYSWRLKDGEVRFRGRGDYADLVNQRIPTEDSQIQRFQHTLDLLDVWTWRNDYHPTDCDMEVHDGSSWSFLMTFGETTHASGGENAYPSFSHPRTTSLTRDRFDLLVAAIHSCFDVDFFIERSKRKTGLE